MSRRIALVLWLTLVWIALWGEVSVANVGGGLLAATTLVALFGRAEPRGRAGPVRPLATARFVGWFVGKLVQASATVAWEVVTPRNRINEGVVAVPLQVATDRVTTIIGNTISLTPGTLTIEIDRDRRVLYVHVLHLDDPDAVRADIARLESLARAAFEPRPAEVP